MKVLNFTADDNLNRDAGDEVLISLGWVSAQARTFYGSMETMFFTKVKIEPVPRGQSSVAWKRSDPEVDRRKTLAEDHLTETFAVKSPYHATLRRQPQ